MSKELIRLRDLVMEFDGERILDSINLYINDHEFSTVFYVFPARWIYIEILNEEYTEWQESKIFIDFSLTPIKLM